MMTYTTILNNVTVEIDNNRVNNISINFKHSSAFDEIDDTLFEYLVNQIMCLINNINHDCWTVNAMKEQHVSLDTSNLDKLQEKYISIDLAKIEALVSIVPKQHHEILSSVLDRKLREKNNAH